MPDQNTNPTAGYGSKRANSIWFSAKNGVFNFKLRDEQGGKSDPLQCDYVHGQMTSVEIRWKEASGEIAGHEELVLTLGGSDHNGEDVLLKVCTHYPSTCAKMLVGYLPHVQAGEHVAVGVWGSKDNAKVTFGKITRVVGTSDVALPRRTDAPKSDREAENRALEGLNGPARERKRRELMDAFSAELDAWARPIVQAHPCFLDQDPQGDTGETANTADPKVTTAQSAAAQPEPGASTSGASPATTAGETASAATQTSSETSEPDVVPPDPLPTAFGFQASRWVKSYTNPANEAQTKALTSAFAARGIDDTTLARNTSERILDAYGVPAPLAGKPLSSGYVTLVYDWVKNASENSLNAAIAAAADGYDPFADE